MPNDDLAISLAILRNIRRWSQAELAETAGVTNSAISDYERGKVDPQTQTLQRLIRAFGLPLSALDQTQAFIHIIRAQMDAGDVDVPGLPQAEGLLNATLTAREREVRTEIAQVASEGGRFASRLTRLMLELMASQSPRE